MGIVLNQSLKNTIITYLGFGIGAIYTLYLYPILLGATYYALTNYILSAANVIMPLFAIGMQNTLVKYYSHYETEDERSQFLSFTILFPILMCIPLGLIGLFFYDDILAFVSKKNAVVREYIWLIPFIGLCMAYFEIFYAWARVHMHSVFGNFIKEVGLRSFSLLALVGVYFKWITVIEFVYVTAGIYFLAFLLLCLMLFTSRNQFFNLVFPTT